MDNKQNNIPNPKVGDLLLITKMDKEPYYARRYGEITNIDDAGQLHGTWGGLAIIPEIDEFIILKGVEKYEKR